MRKTIRKAEQLEVGDQVSVRLIVDAEQRGTVLPPWGEKGRNTVPVAGLRGCEHPEVGC
jgi:hypothetical protein